MSLSDILANTQVEGKKRKITSILDSLSISSSLSSSLSSSENESKSNMYMDMLNDFYSVIEDELIFKIIDIINRKSKISLRLIEWFVSKYAQNHIINIYEDNGKLFNVYNSYHVKTKVYEKKYFDLFRRVNVISYCFKQNPDMQVETTISQLNFFKWLIENNIYSYIEKNRENLSKLMSSDNAIERDNRKRRMIISGKSRRKKCKDNE